MLPYSWTGLSGASGYVIQSTGTANNGNPNWTIDVGNVTTFTDTGSLSGSVSLPASFTSLNPYPVVVPPADSAGIAPVNTGQNDYSGNYYADGSTSATYNVYGCVTIAGVCNYVGSAPASPTFNDDNDNNNFGIGVSWNTITGADSYVVQRSVYNSTTGSLSGFLNVGNTTGHNDDGANNWTDPTPVGFSFAGTTRQYGIQARSSAPDGTQVYYPSAQTYTIADNNSVPYVIDHTITLNGNAVYALTGDPAGDSYNYYRVDSATDLIEGSSSFWLPGTIGPLHYGYLANGSNLHRFYADYGVQSTYYAPTAPTAVTTDPNDNNYYYVKLNQTLGASNTNSKVLRGIGSASYSNGKLSSALPVSGSDYYDLAFTTWGDGTTITPNTLYPPAAIFSNHGAAITDIATEVLKSLDGGYSRLEFQDNTGAQKGYLDTTDGITLANTGVSSLNLGTNIILRGAGTIVATPLSVTKPTTLNPGSDAANALVVQMNSSSQTSPLLQFATNTGTTTGLAYFDAHSSLVLAQGTPGYPGLVIPAGSGFTTTPKAGALEWNGGSNSMPSFTDSTPTRHTMAALDFAQTFTAAQTTSAGLTVGNSYGQPNIHFQTNNLLSTLQGD